MEHLALNAYRWGDAAQDRVLAGCVEPAVRRLRGAGRVRRFWFSRFDARGPHLALFVGAPDGCAGDAGAVLTEELERWLAADPCTTVLAADELARRHDDCKGAELSSLDGEAGTAANDTVRVAPHPADGFPFRDTAAVAAEDELWELLTDLALWSAGRVGAGEAAGAATLWIASVDAALRRAGAPAEAWWRRYVATLLPGLAERVRDDDELAARVPGLLGERNLARLEAAWEAAEGDPRRFGGTGRLMEIVAAADGREPLERFRLFRLINHSVLGQLGRPVRMRIPLALFAWLNARAVRAG
jgi:hypothetical protein